MKETNVDDLRWDLGMVIKQVKLLRLDFDRMTTDRKELKAVSPDLLHKFTKGETPASVDP